MLLCALYFDVPRRAAPMIAGNKAAIAVVCRAVGLCAGAKGGRVSSRRDAGAAEIPRRRRHARALAGDNGAADDLIQDTLERAIARLDQWRDGDSPRKWLFSILHNLHVDSLRRKSRRPP